VYPRKLLRATDRCFWTTDDFRLRAVSHGLLLLLHPISSSLPPQQRSVGRTICPAATVQIVTRHKKRRFPDQGLLRATIAVNIAASEDMLLDDQAGEFYYAATHQFCVMPQNLRLTQHKYIRISTTV
jgi:hypothetical protein